MKCEPRHVSQGAKENWSGLASRITIVSPTSRRLQVEFFQELVHGQPVMSGDKFQNTFKGPNFDGMMIGNCDVELAVKLGGQADVGTVLPDAFVAQNA